MGCLLLLLLYFFSFGCQLNAVYRAMLPLGYSATTTPNQLNPIVFEAHVRLILRLEWRLKTITSADEYARAISELKLECCVMLLSFSPPAPGVVLPIETMWWHDAWLGQHLPQGLDVIINALMPHGATGLLIWDKLLVLLEESEEDTSLPRRLLYQRLIHTFPTLGLAWCALARCFSASASVSSVTTAEVMLSSTVAYEPGTAALSNTFPKSCQWLMTFVCDIISQALVASRAGVVLRPCLAELGSMRMLWYSSFLFTRF
jgi:hypothetical protein